jgi:hypothetical protein
MLALGRHLSGIIGAAADDPGIVAPMRRVDGPPILSFRSCFSKSRGSGLLGESGSRAPLPRSISTNDAARLADYKRVLPT